VANVQELYLAFGEESHHDGIVFGCRTCSAPGSARVAISGEHDCMHSERTWWSKTRLLMIICLAVLAVFGFLVHAFAEALNHIAIFGFPLGFYMAAQGSPIAFVILVFWFASRQDRIDRSFGNAEE